MPPFSGQVRTTRDSKNRVIIPSKMRRAAGDLAQEGFYVTEGMDGCIKIQTVARFVEVSEQDAKKTARNTMAGRMLERLSFANAEPTQCDRQGRLRLPAQLLQDLQIGKDLVVAGVNDRIEVWDAARWDQILEEARRHREKNAEQVHRGPEE